MILKIAMLFSVFLQTTAAGSCNNGAGGTFSCHLGMSDQEIALSACKSVYGSCSSGVCGYFTYYYAAGRISCGCNKAVGQHEFIYENRGYTFVGQDYHGQNTGHNVAGNSLFSRWKASRDCKVTAWRIVLSNLGAEATAFPTATPTENPTTLGPTESPTNVPSSSPTESPTNVPTRIPTNVPTRIPCKDQFRWCVFPNICDDVDFRLFCPFSCDDCRTAAPTSMPTAFPTEDCAGREDILEGVVDHMLNHYLKSEEDDEISESRK
jgi:hypothetical protein